MYLAAGLGIASAIAGGVIWSRRAARARVIAPVVAAPSGLAALPPDARSAVDGAIARGRAGDVAALGELSRLYHANGFFAEATRCYEVLEALQPDEPRWPHRHATLAAGFGEARAAESRWRRVIGLAPDYLPARLRLGELLLKTNRSQDAAAVFGDVLQRKPDDPHAALGLARIEIEAGRWPQARERLEKIVAQTDYALGYDLIVTVYEQLGMPAQAAAVRSRTKASGAYRDFADPWITELLDACYDPYQLALAAGVAERTGESDRAVRLLERAVEIAPDNVATRFQLAGVYGQRRDQAKARQQLERCTVIAPDFADGWAHLSSLLEQSGDAAGAERTLLAGLRQCPDSPGLHLMRARQFRRAGNLDNAIASYRRSIQLRANEAEAYVELATLLFQANRSRDAVQQLEQALEVEPEHPVALSVLALSAISSGDEASASRWIARVRAQPRVAPAQVQQIATAFRAQFGREAR